MKKEFIGLFLLLFFAMSFSFAQEDESEGECIEKLEKKIQKTYDKAVEARKKGKREEARSLFLNVIEAEPDFPNAYYFLGLSYLREIQNQPSEYNSREIMEYQQLLPQRMSNAIQYFSKSIEVCADYNIQTYYFLGKLYYTKEMYNESAKYLKHYVSNKPLIRNEEDFQDRKSVV